MKGAQCPPPLPEVLQVLEPTQPAEDAPRLSSCPDSGPLPCPSCEPSLYEH